tara:strand:+ start:101 stop:397 length:297 start_codon:yes stop_codon:yes gene_type:complete
MEIDDKENVMENLQAVIDSNMKEAQCDTWADDKSMQTMFIEDAVAAFAIKKDIEKGSIAEAVERFSHLDTSPMEDIALALEKDKGREWTEETFGIRFA